VTPSTIILDASVLMLAVPGRRLDRLLESFASQVTFLAPEVAFDDVGEDLTSVLIQRGELNALQPALEDLTKLDWLCRPWRKGSNHCAANSPVPSTTLPLAATVANRSTGTTPDLCFT